MNIDATKIRGLLFDYGGTIDSGGDHWSEVIWSAYQQAGVVVDKNIFRDAYVYAERELARVKHILPHHTFRDMMLIKMKIELQWLAEHGDIAADIVEAKSREVAEICYASAQSHVEDSKRVLEQLAPRYPMVLVSNFYGNVESVLADFGIDKYFKTIVESAVVGVRKPDPRIFALGVEALGMKPEETLVIGDSYRKDIVPAESIGCQVLWIKGKGWTAEEDAQTHPNMVQKLDELVKILP
ncbi:MAG: HAD family hydrolase [Lepagella sp.]